jgi:hypothetical protein
MADIVVAADIVVTAGIAVTAGPRRTALSPVFVHLVRWRSACTPVVGLELVASRGR